MPNLKKELPIVLRYKSGGGQSGVSLFLVISIMTIFLAITLGLSAIFLGQMVMLRGMGYSVIALYAADAGIEEILVVRASPPIGPRPVVTLPNGATYRVIVQIRGAGTCTAPNYCIKSLGTYKGVRRAIEITY